MSKKYIYTYLYIHTYIHITHMYIYMYIYMWAVHGYELGGPQDTSYRQYPRGSRCLIIEESELEDHMYHCLWTKFLTDKVSGRSGYLGPY